MRPQEVVACVVCGGSVSEIICTAQEIRVQQDFLRRFHRRRLRPGAPCLALEERADFTQDYATHIVACAACGLLFRNPRPSAAAIAQAYARDDYDPARLEALFHAQRAQFRPKARRLARALPPQARIVEVGSFVGGFLAAGRELGWEMQGVDPGAEVNEFCAAQGLSVFRGDIEQLPCPPASLDCIAIWNTFDQLPDPRPTLDAARRLLRPGGLLVLRVPNGLCFRRAMTGRHRLWGRMSDEALAWNNLLSFPYLYGYSVPTLDRLLAPYGLRRRAARPDTLVPLADSQTRPWAVWEERIVKSLCRLAAAWDARRPGSDLAHAPWLDLSYRLGAPW